MQSCREYGKETYGNCKDKYVGSKGKELCIFERSTQNMLRSIALYYGKGVMRKVKYMSACSIIVFERLAAKKKAVRIKVANCPIPKLVPYQKLMPYIRSIDIGKLFSVRETLCDGLEDAEKVIGCYRNLEDLVLKLAEFYLCNDLYDILTFGIEPYTFHIALGGDGAPFGKDDTACSWLVSILNIGRGVLSSNENFLLFGANCKEDCVPVKRFINILMKDISTIESTTYTIACKGSSVQAKFFVSELPNDMKMLAFLGGELSISAKYYSSFADVTADDHRNAKGTFGKEKNCTWKPWEYAKRLEVAAEVVKMKAKVNVQPISEATKRSKVTKFIAGKKSRQEFAPRVGRVIDRVHVDPLHLKNNICALVHRHILNLVMSMSKLSSSVTCFSKVPHTSPFFLYIDTLRSKCCLSRLAKKVQKWFNDTNGKGKDFDYRFTGKDSRLFLHNFMFLIDVLEQLSTDMEKKVFHIHAYLCLCLRECVSLFCRVTISNEQVSRLQELCTSFFRGYFLFFNINSTIWTFGYVVPSHTREMKGKYGFGLGLNSMEGREAKHIAIAQYARNTAYRQRWEQIFLHEYISLIWLREKGYRTSSVTPTTLSYIQARVKENGFCNCGLSKAETEDKCRFCNHSFRKKIEVRIANCKSMF